VNGGQDRLARESFERILLESLDKSLAILGESGRQTIYDHLERNYRIKRDEIPEKPQALHEALERLLGAGAKVLEKLFAKGLSEKLGLDFVEHENWTLVEYVHEAKKARAGS